jgi:hypothetical protein
VRADDTAEYTNLRHRNRVSLRSRCTTTAAVGGVPNFGY